MPLITAIHLTDLNNLSDLDNATTALTNLLPSQTGKSGKLLTTNGTIASWSETSISPMDPYIVNHLDDGSTATNVLYVGLAKDDGTYCIKKLDETSSALPVVTYATVTNNPATTTYATAWTNRATMTYDVYQTSF
jgi:hypothetical protein